MAKRPRTNLHLLGIIDSMAAVVIAAREVTQDYRATSTKVSPLIVNQGLWKLERAVLAYDHATFEKPDVRVTPVAKKPAKKARKK